MLNSYNLVTKSRTESVYELVNKIFNEAVECSLNVFYPFYLFEISKIAKNVTKNLIEEML